jgi:clan AA aspartic protease
MILGTVNQRREAVLRLRIRGPQGAALELAAVIDTGFSASLTLPAETIAALGLVRQSVGRAALADGSIRQFGLYVAEVEWDGLWKPVIVSAIGAEVLVGMGLLAGHELRAAVVPGGKVEIAPLP